MEETTQKIQTGNDDEVLVKQADGSFKLVRVSDLGVLKPPVFQLAQKKEEKPATAMAPAPVKQAPAPFIPSIQLYDQTAEELIKKSGLAIAPDLQKRFKIIIISRLKDVRKLPEVRERLLALPLAGGVGLRAEEAERIIKMLEEERGKITNYKLSPYGGSPEGRQIINKFQIPNIKTEPVAPQQITRPGPELPAIQPVKKEAVVSPPIRGSQRGSVSSQRPPLVPPDRGEKLSSPPPPPPAPFKPTTFSAKGGFALGEQPINQLTSKPAPQPPVATMPQIPPHARPALGRDSLGRDDIMTSSDIKLSLPSVVKIIPQEKKPPQVELTPPPILPAKPKPIFAIPQAPSGRSKVEDVAYKPRLMGPIEELKEMSLVDFRRLSPQSKVTADKIYAKIELLVNEGYAKKIKGIEAWQKSPVNQIYLAILNESIVQGKPVDKVMEERQTGGRETLTPEEFKAVMELNRRLRY